MAGLADAATDRVSIASAPATGPLTICAWVKLANTVNATNTIMRFDAGGGTALILALRSLVPGLYSAASTTGVAGSAVSTGTWTFVAGTRDAANAGQLFQGTTPGSLTKTTATVSSTGTPSSVNVYGRSTSDATDWFSGSLAYVRVWTAVLSDAEIAAESQSATPVRTSGLWASWALAAAALTDGSANARNLTAGSTALSSDTDPALGTTITGTGAAVAPAVAAAGTGTVLVAGTGAATAPPVVAAGTAAVRVTGSGAANAPPVSAAGTGSAIVTGSGAATAPAVASSGQGSVVVAGQGAPVAPPTTAAGSGAVVVSGTGAATAPPVVAAGTGTLGTTVTGTGAAVAPPVVASGTGRVIVTGVGAAVAPPVVAQGFDRAVVPAVRPKVTIRPNLAGLAAAANPATASCTPNRALLTITEEA